MLFYNYKLDKYNRARSLTLEHYGMEMSWIYGRTLILYSWNNRPVDICAERNSLIMWVFLFNVYFLAVLSVLGNANDTRITLWVGIKSFLTVLIAYKALCITPMNTDYTNCSSLQKKKKKITQINTEQGPVKYSLPFYSLIYILPLPNWEIEDAEELRASYWFSWWSKKSLTALFSWWT